MEIEIATIGGYEAVGRQMSAVRAADDVAIFDMGLNLSQGPIHDNVHVSGHLRQEGHSQRLDVLQPRHVIPAHQSPDGVAPSADRCENQGYAVGRDLHDTQNSNMIQLVE